MLSYKGYVGVSDLDNDAGAFHGRVLGIREPITFRGTTVDELRRSFRESIDAYLASCDDCGRKPEKPFSGRVLIRMPSELHRDIFLTAQQNAQSVNRWIIERLAQAVTPSV